MNKKKTAAVVLAAGQGKRMQSSVAKQFLLLAGEPVVCHALRAFEESEVELALEMGTKPVTLGRRILRTETAGLTMLSMLIYVLEA